MDKVQLQLTTVDRVARPDAKGRVALGDLTKGVSSYKVFVDEASHRIVLEPFVELFHDEGDTDQLALFRTYRELGLDDVPCRCDHVPAMAGEGDEPGFVPGYGTLGRLFANGSLTALLAAAGRAHPV